MLRILLRFTYLVMGFRTTGKVFSKVFVNVIPASVYMNALLDAANLGLTSLDLRHLFDIVFPTCTSVPSFGSTMF